MADTENRPMTRDTYHALRSLALPIVDGGMLTIQPAVLRRALDEIDRLNYGIERRNKALVKWGRHDEGCPCAISWNVDHCNCGWYAQRRELVGA